MRANGARSMIGRRGWLTGLAALPFATHAAAPPAARMILLERHDCPWCRRWLREVGEASWNLSDLGRRAPLRRVDVAQGLPEDLRILANWRFTPTFVLVSHDREIGRVIGYQADIFFWQQAEALMARLPAIPEEPRR